MATENTVAENIVAENIVDTDEQHWHTIINHDNYEINDEYPYNIRRKGTDKNISEHIADTGYVCINLNGHPYIKHRIIATQFIPNDDPINKTDIDHINHDRTDYHIENLRWITKSNNSKNKTSHCGVIYEYFDTINDDAILVNNYGNHEFEFYYYSEEDDEFYYYTGHQYRKLHVNTDKRTGAEYVYMMNTDNKRIHVFINKFKRLYDIDF